VPQLAAPGRTWTWRAASGEREQTRVPFELIWMPAPTSFSSLDCS
jgi:hypothetical protein